MKKTIIILLTLFIATITSSFTTIDELIADKNKKEFDIDKLLINEKKYIGDNFDLCGTGSVKTYMEYSLITSPRSKQYQYIQDNMNIDESGFLYDEDGFIGAALGSYFGTIGDKYYFTLENGVVLPIVKIESKADIHTDETNCYNPVDQSIIEFVIDTTKAAEYFGRTDNGLILSGNFGNYLAYKGSVVKVEKVTENPIKKEITYNPIKDTTKEINIFYYGSGY